LYFVTLVFVCMFLFVPMELAYRRHLLFKYMYQIRYVMSILPLSTIFIFEFGKFYDIVVFLVVCFSSSFFTEKEKRFTHSFELSKTNNLFLSLSV